MKLMDNFTAVFNTINYYYYSLSGVDLDLKNGVNSTRIKFRHVHFILWYQSSSKKTVRKMDLIIIPVLLFLVLFGN